MPQSILNSTKKVLGLADDYDPFDVDVIMHINTVFARLAQLGVGPLDGFSIQDDKPTWEDFLQGATTFNDVKSYMYLRVRLLFDPPTTTNLLTSMNQQIQEFEWLLNVKREEYAWRPGLTVSRTLNGGRPYAN